MSDSLNACGGFDSLRKTKICNTTAVDWVATIAAAFAGAYVWSKYSDTEFELKNVGIAFVILVIVAIVVHYVTSTPTMLGSYLGINSLDAVLKRRKECGY